MRYALLLKPHANVRYRQSLEKLALLELRCMLESWGLTTADPRLDCLAGEQFITFSADDLPQSAWRDLSRHSGICFAASITSDGALMPLQRQLAQSLPDDLPHVLKYKGKTNADFTSMMIHCARAASDFATCSERMTVFDPMCGKATTLFCALCEGNDAVGVELDTKALTESDTYLSRSLKLHRIKHKRVVSSLTLKGGGSARATMYTVAGSPEWLLQEPQSLRLINADATRAGELLKPESCNLVVCDLPYGVQHAPQESKGISSLSRLLQRALPGCVGVMKRGGAMALSFNQYTLPRAEVEAAMAQAGLTVCDHPPYDDFSHWVEQAVQRDMVIARKESVNLRSSLN